MNKLTSSILISSILLTACASQGGWVPTVDPYNDPYEFRTDIPHPQKISIQNQLIDFECLFFEGAECRLELIKI